MNYVVLLRHIFWFLSVVYNYLVILFYLESCKKTAKLKVFDILWHNLLNKTMSSNCITHSIVNCSIVKYFKYKRTSFWIYAYFKHRFNLLRKKHLKEENGNIFDTWWDMPNTKSFDYPGKNDWWRGRKIRQTL